MILSAHQGGYLCSMALLDRIAQSDIFVLLNRCQFEKGSFTNRQKIGNLWLTIPVSAKGKPSIQNTKIASQQWQRKHYNFLWHRYSGQERLDEVEAKLMWMYSIKFKYLGGLLAHHLVFWLQEYGITTPVVMMPENMHWDGGTDMIIKLCQHFKADEYLSGPMGKNYLDEAKCQEKNLKVHHYESQLSGTTRSTTTKSVMEHWMITHLNPFQSSSSGRTLMTSNLDAEEQLPPMLIEGILSTS